ncbi:MAG TPA: hypothetical protein VK826_02295 [Bacteroidia bacterium]|nr:hypothetical protein [Bacteroidia bacterium]
MKKHITIFAALFFLAGNINATHVPGYMGKKLSIGANVSTFFMFEDFTTVSDVLFSTRLSYKSELALTYTVARKVSLGGSFYYGTQRYRVGLRDYDNGNYNGQYVTLEEDFLKCKLMIFEFNAKFFRRNFLAPIGPYHQFGVGVVKYKAVAPGDSLVLVNSDDDNIPNGTIELNPEPYSCIKLSYHIGYAAPVFKNCFFNFAFGVNFFRAGDSAKIKTDLNKNNYTLGIMNKHLRRHNFLEIKIGFSWLAL